MVTDVPFSVQLATAIESLRTELAERVAVLKAMEELLDACKAQEDAGWRVECVDDLLGNADTELARARLASAMNAIQQNIEASAQG